MPGVWTLGVIACGSLAMFALGLWDDLRAVGAKTKLAAQIMIASGVYLADIRVELFKDPLTETDLDPGLLGLFWHRFLAGRSHQPDQSHRRH